MLRMYILLPSLLGLVLLASAQGQNCSSKVGSLNPSLSIDEVHTSRGGVFLNINESAECRGVVMGWRYCYYILQQSSSMTKNRTFTATIGAWQRVFTNNKTYFELVNESFRELPTGVSPASSTKVQFVCQEWTLPVSSRFTIEPGTAVGIFLPREEQELVIAIGQQKAVTFQFDGEHSNVFRIQSNQLRVMDGVSLLAQALLGNESSTTESSITEVSESPTDLPPSEVLPLWIVSLLSVVSGALTILLVTALCLAVHKCKEALKRKRFPTTHVYEEAIEIQDLHTVHKSYSDVSRDEVATSHCSERQINKMLTERQLGTHQTIGQKRCCNTVTDSASTTPNGNILAQKLGQNLDSKLSSKSSFMVALTASSDEEHEKDNNILLDSMESEYPYVLHTHEVLGYRIAGRLSNSLPNVCHNASLTTSAVQPSVSEVAIQVGNNPSSSHEQIYSNPYDYAIPRALCTSPMRIDLRGRISSSNAASYFGIQRKKVLTKPWPHKHKTVKAALSVPKLLSPDYMEIPEDWTPQRNKPMPLPRKSTYHN